MTSNRMKSVASSLALAILAASCNTDKLTSLNKNPNSPEDVPAAYGFSGGRSP